jgi:hypothetical protein
METGLYFGIRFFDDALGEPELTFNKPECEGYRASEFVNLVGNKLLPFCLMVPGTGYGVFSAGSVVLKMVCDDIEIGIGTNPVDWESHEYEGNTYLFYKAENVIYPSQAVTPGVYYFKLSFMLGVTRSFYSDYVVVKEYAGSTELPNYTITFSVVGGNGTISATVAGQPIASGTQRWSGTIVTFTASPAAGYYVKEWVLNGSVVEGNNVLQYQLLLSGNSEVTVEFTQSVYSTEYSDEYLK